MNASSLLATLHQAVQERVYFTHLVILDQSWNMLKARLYLAPNLFVQVYRNDRFDTTNLVVIHNDQRIFGRDQLGGQWHRHPAEDPASHDTGPEGRLEVTLNRFLDEVETVLANLGLP